MIRAAAKNHADVTVVVEPADYAPVLGEMAQHAGMTTLELRQRLAAKAYARTAAYDAAISNWFADTLHETRPGLPRLRRQARRSLALRREPAPERGVLPHAGASASASPRRGSCRARSSPTTTSTTPTRHTNASPSSTPGAPPPASSSSTPTPAASPKARACSTPTKRRWPATRPRPSAALSRSTARSTRRRRRRSPRSSPR